ncbi:MAG TPA: hypothetical protein VF384_05945 [Planctomycetota bacterium]
MGIRPSLGAVLLCTAIASGQAPPGYKTYENKTATLRFFYPVAYQEMPLPPTEQVVVAKYILKEKPDALKEIDDRLYKSIEQQLHVYRFDVQGPETGSGADKPAQPDDKPATVREAMEAHSRVTSWEQFVKRFAQWNVVEDRKKPDWFSLTWKGEWPANGARPIGCLVRKREGTAVFGLYGFTLQPCEKAFMVHVQKVAGSLVLAAEQTAAAAEAVIDRLYTSGKYRGVEFRKKARAELAKEWRAVDTENYLIVHHSKNEALINQIAREIEAMRALYTELFPPTGPMDTLSVVRVCRTMEEYHQYGGPPNTGGYWHPGNEELVFFDYSYTMKTLDKDERRAMGDRVLTNDDSLLVLYHEAFHQYIHYAVGEVAPHDWFNEGYGDYFSGAVVSDTTSRVLRVDPSSWRIHLAKDMCEFGEGFVPLAEILKAERAAFYNPARIRFFYAGAWSFVFFLKHSKEVAAHAQWSKILQTYFDSVKDGYRDELAKFGSTPDLQGKMVAGFQARKAALAKTLEGLDIAELEKAWRKWVVDMKDPWPSKRKKRK